MITYFLRLVRRVPIIIIPTAMDNKFVSFVSKTTSHFMGNYHFIIPGNGCRDIFINYPNGIWHI